jgi:hypothetical protein
MRHRASTEGAGGEGKRSRLADAAAPADQRKPRITHRTHSTAAVSTQGAAIISKGGTQKTNQQAKTRAGQFRGGSLPCTHSKANFSPKTNQSDDHAAESAIQARNSPRLTFVALIKG